MNLDQWSFDRWLAVVSLAIAVLSVILAFFAITNDRLTGFLIRWRFRGMPAAFQQMAKEYRQADSIPDNDPGPVKLSTSDIRVRRKDVLAQGLGAYAWARNLDRAALARGDDGYVAALMKLIAFEPRAADAELVATAATTRVPPHTDHLILAAITVLAEKRLISDNQRGVIAKAVGHVAERLGDDHKSAIARVRTAVRQA
jgi:hypothetical protein